MGANEGDIYSMLEFVSAGKKKGGEEDGKRDKEDVFKRKETGCLTRRVRLLTASP